MCLWLISRVLRWSVSTILSNVITAFVEARFAEAQALHAKRPVDEEESPSWQEEKGLQLNDRNRKKHTQYPGYSRAPLCPIRW